MASLKLRDVALLYILWKWLHKDNSVPSGNVAAWSRERGVTKPWPDPPAVERDLSKYVPKKRIL